MDKDCTQFAVLIQCHDSTGCDEMGDYFAIEADTMIDIVRLTWIKIVFEYLYLIGIFVKAAYSATMNIFRKKKILFESFVKVE